MAKEVLHNLANVPPTSRAIIIHIFPLLAASCEVGGGGRPQVGGRSVGGDDGAYEYLEPRQMLDRRQGGLGASRQP